MVNVGQIHECTVSFSKQLEKTIYLHINMATMPKTKPMRPAFVGVH